MDMTSIVTDLMQYCDSRLNYFYYINQEIEAENEDSTILALNWLTWFVISLLYKKCVTKTNTIWHILLMYNVVRILKR